MKQVEDIFSTLLFEYQNFIKFDEDIFDEYSNSIVVSEEYHSYVRKWLLNSVSDTMDYFVIVAIEDLIDGIDTDKNYKAGINFECNGQQFSIYSYKKSVVFTSINEITLDQIKNMIGV